jgi:hypothetical protein
MTVSSMFSQNMPYSLFIPFISGTSIGSLCGAFISGRIEKWLGLTADATKKIENAANKRKTIDKKYFITALVFLTLPSFYFSNDAIKVLTILFMAYIQNTGFALSSRARNRDNEIFVVFTTVLSSVLFFLTFRYLIRNDMPFALFIPYTTGTVFGSLTGANLSVYIEKIFGIKPDSHVTGEKKKNSLNPWRVFNISISLGLMFLVVSRIFPFEENILSLWFIFAVFAVNSLDSITYTLASRASNRNNVNYHLAARLLVGVVAFMKLKYYKQGNMSYELYPAILLGDVTGGVLGQKTSKFVESREKVVMDDAKS